MKKTLPFWLLMAVWPWTSTGSMYAAEQAAADFYVSPTGNDTWSGTLAEKNAEATDGPFATFARAQRAVRELMHTGRTEPVLVLLRGGTYWLSEPITFKPANSGTDRAPITYAAYPNEQPVCSGGKPVGTGWTKNDDGTWTTLAEKAKHFDWAFRQLFINGKRAVRARIPNEGFLRTAGLLPGMEPKGKDRYNNRSRGGFEYQPGDIRNGSNLSDANVVVYHAWTTSRHWIAALDEENRLVTFTNRSGWPLGFWEEKDQRYYVENFPEALDAPGEWYLDRWTGNVTYMPREGEDVATAEFIAPHLHQLVIFDGDRVNGDYVRHITLRGLSFRHAAWKAGREECIDNQGAARLTAAVIAEGARHITLDDCEVAHVGEYGIYFNRGCSHNRIVNCRLHDLGAGGVRIGATDRELPAWDVSEHNVVDNCLIHDGGHIFHAGVGVLVGHASYTTVTHNEIFDFDYSGVNVGWGWGYKDVSTAHHNIIEFNHIYNIGRGQLSDLAGIYTLGKSPGTVLRNNLVHDVQTNLYGGWGLYCDAASSDILLENNIVYRTSHGGFHQNYGKENIVRNNIFAFGEVAQLTRTTVEDHISFIIEQNIVYFDTPNLLRNRWSKDMFIMDRNLFWRTGGQPFDFDGISFEEWRKRGHDRNSLIADPLFVDPENGDFTLKPGSPAETIGFVPIDTSKIGRLNR